MSDAHCIGLLARGGPNGVGFLLCGTGNGAVVVVRGKTRNATFEARSTVL